MPVATDSSDALVVTVSRERVELARATHRRIIRTFFVLFGILAAVILGGGIFLSTTGRTSLPGILIVGALFVAFPFLARLWILRVERRGERYLARDGETLLRLDPTALTVGDVTIPWDRITCLYANVPGEIYSGGGIRSEAMGQRLNLAEREVLLARGVGSRAGTSLRKRMYRDGALSTITLAIGVDQAATLNAPEGYINPLRTLPKSGFDSGRLDIPFGAYLDVDDFVVLWPALEAIGRERFPVKIVTGDLAWASATVSAAGTREQIWKDAAGL